MDVFASHLSEISTDHGMACLKLKRVGEGEKYRMFTRTQVRQMFLER